MNRPERISPRARALASVPNGITATRIKSEAQWLSLRASDVTASVAAALFGDGAHPYTTAYELWARASGKVIPADKDKQRQRLFRRGRIMQAPILTMSREDYPDWRLEDADVYYSDPLARIGATPDYYAIRPDRPGFGVVDGKSVGQFAKGWLDEEKGLRLPIWVAFQVAIQAALSGASWGAVAALEMGEFELTMIELPMRPLVMVKLRVLVDDFWRRVRDNDPYPIDWNRDAALVAALYDPDEAAPLLQLGDDKEVAKWLDEWEAYKQREADGAAASRERKKLQGKLLARLDNATGAILADGRSYSVTIVKRAGYTAPPTQYPQITIRDFIK